jgi:uncharacterized membrane protein YidH (DUF202 family)
MTLEEMEAELGRLRAIEEARRKSWRSIRTSAAICAIAFVIVGVGFQIAALLDGAGRSHTLQVSAALFIMMSLPLSLLRLALADPVVRAP